MTGTLYFYRVTTNTVEEYNTPISYDLFVEEETGNNSFWSGPRTDGKLEIHANSDECIFLNENKQTAEQAVILFATMLALREAASEE